MVDLADLETFGELLRAFRKRRSEEHTSELQSQSNLVCRLLLEKKNNDFSQQLTGKRSSRCLISLPLLHHSSLLRIFFTVQTRQYIIALRHSQRLLLYSFRYIF